MKPRPLNLKDADRQGSDAFFAALLESCTTPTRTSEELLDYESTPEPSGHRDAKKSHRKCGNGKGDSGKRDAGDGRGDRRGDRRRRRLKDGPPTEWPERTSSIRGVERYSKRREAESLRTSFESVEEPAIEDGYDCYSDARHDVVRNHGFWPRRKSGAEAAPVVVRPRQDYDGTSVRNTTPSRQEKNRKQRHDAAQSNGDPRRSLLFEPHLPTPLTYPSIPARFSSRNHEHAVSAPSSQSPSFPAEESEDDDEDSDSDSNPDLTFEHTSLFHSRSRRSSPPSSISSSMWPHIYPPWSPTNAPPARPPFKESKLEAYRLSDPALLPNINKPLPETPYHNLGWSTLSRDEFLMAVGHYALRQGVELPLVYAARGKGREWQEEEDVREGWEEFCGRVEEVCSAQLEVWERMEKGELELARRFGVGALEREGVVEEKV